MEIAVLARRALAPGMEKGQLTGAPWAHAFDYETQLFQIRKIARSTASKTFPNEVTFGRSTKCSRRCSVRT